MPVSNQNNALVHGTLSGTTYTGVTLTASYVYSSMFTLIDNSQIDVLVEYTAATVGAGIKCDLIVDVSPDPWEVSSANSKWINIGTVSNSSGTLTFTQSTLKIVSAASAVTTDWNFSTQGKKYRIGIKEEGSPGAFGTVIVWVFNKATS